jgi:dienelactone hydrolase
MRHASLPALALALIPTLGGCIDTTIELSDTGMAMEAEGTGTGGGTSAATEGTSGSGSSGAPGDTSGTEGADASSGSDDSGGETASRCEVTALTLTCTHQSTTIYTGFTGLVPREVQWQVPLGEPPAGGWPAAIVFQGSIFTAELFWVVLDVETLGFWNQGMLTKTLLDSGFAVITPEAHLGGFTAWETNVPPMSVAWETAEDDQLMLDLFEEIEIGGFGPIDPQRLYATGISSGGYMTSRMDEAYRERFNALAIHSASWATCAGPVCEVPDDLDAGHLPTMFLHGTADPIVPMSTMLPYRDALDALGVETATVLGEGVEHAWLDEAPAAIVGWFQEH